MSPRTTRASARLARRIVSPSLSDQEPESSSSSRTASVEQDVASLEIVSSMKSLDPPLDLMPLSDSQGTLDFWTGLPVRELQEPPSERRESSPDDLSSLSQDFSDEERGVEQANVRRSPRKTTVKRALHEDSDSSSEPDLSDDDYMPGQAKHVAKRRRTTSSGRKDIVLPLVNEISTEILAEIFTHLQPLDLINLTMTSKALRKLLLARSSGFIWRAVRENVPTEPAPECPDDLTEAAWTALIYWKRCFACGQPAVRLDWNLCVSYCRSCSYTRRKGNAGFEFPGVWADVLRLARYSTESTWRERRRSRDWMYFWEPHVMAVYERLLRFEEDVKHGVPNAREDRDNFIEERGKIVEKSAKKAHEYWAWQRRVAMQRLADKEQLRRERNLRVEELLDDLDTHSPQATRLARRWARYALPLSDRSFNSVRRRIDKVIRNERDAV